MIAYTGGVFPDFFAGSMAQSVVQCGWNIAYPPFWYYLGHTAVEISFSELGLSEDKKKGYKEEAIQHFKQYRATNQQGLLREDPVSSTCALEYIDLLDPVTDKQLIMELLDEAYSFSGRKEDILQLCAM
ncbi:MAG: hypothetical protein VZR73_11265, partial [Acutalibacteraceae bacterium]|nr:hypothetical protein [Acutalibacteraceae bacterium]